MQRRHDDPRIGLTAVGFSPADRLAAIARHRGWRGDVFTDPQRRLYTRLGIGRAPWWRVYTPGALAPYARALAHGELPKAPAEDTRQLGGDAVLVDGVVRILWRPRTPDDRPCADDVLAAAATAVEATGS